MKWTCVGFGLGVLLACAVIARAEESPRTAAWIATLAGHDGGEAERAAARKEIAALTPVAKAQAVVRKLLSHHSFSARVQGARVACEMGERGLALLPDVLENLRDRQGAVRAEAVLAVGVLEGHVTHRPPSAATLGRVVRLLDDPIADVRAAALESLARLEALGADAVVERLLDEDWARKTLTALFKKQGASTFTVQALLGARSWHVRQHALRTLYFYVRAAPKGADLSAWVEPVGARALDDLSSAVRATAVNVLGQLGRRGADVAAPLVTMLSSGTPGARATAHSVVNYLSLASHDEIARLLVLRLGASDAQERGSAAWLLRNAAPENTSVDDALRRRLQDPEPLVVEAAAAALLDRGHDDSVLVPHLLGFVASVGVPWPFPRPVLSDWGRDLGIGGGRRYGHAGYPGFSAQPGWCAVALGRMGPASVASLLTRLGEAKPERRITWIHALGHAGASGRALLASKAAKLTPAESFELGLMRVHAGAADAALVAVMLSAVQAGPHTELAEEAAWDDGRHGEYDARRKHALALDALVKLAPLSIDVLVAAMAGAKANEKGWLPDWKQDVERALRAIGKPALPAVQRAAADGETGHLFTGLAERLKGK